MSVTEPAKIPAIVSHHIGNLASAIALICIIGNEQSANVVAFFTPGDASSDLEFRKALFAEDCYCTAVLNFDDVTDLNPAANRIAGFAGIAADLGVERVVSMIARTTDGAVLTGHDYADLEYSLIEGVQTQLSRFAEIIDGSSYPKTTDSPVYH